MNTLKRRHPGEALHEEWGAQPRSVLSLLLAWLGMERGGRGLSCLRDGVRIPVLLISCDSLPTSSDLCAGTKGDSLLKF